eukprot:TRINITY_DN7383_c0_g1_i2.p1 TRINITY_DN7383_c0_g1~~TRINITY_DN7383_c0_g1_i2.p1  ORF type:complete len:301 (+),score=68.39 TRINITY_DN7383_c0_g1_i2:205-1107(+)
MSICLTGTTGKLGGSVLKHLLKLVADPSTITLAVHNVDKVPKELSEQGLKIKQADYNDPKSMDAAFEGVHTLLLVSHPGIAHLQRVNSHKNAIEAAKRAGVQHLVYTSLNFAGDSVSAVMRAHIDTEAFLKASGLTYTIIREGIYNESFPLYLGFYNTTKEEINVPADGPISWVSIDDDGEATAKILVDAANYKNLTLVFTGQKATTFQEMCDYIAKITKRPLKLNIVSKEEYIKENIHRGEELVTNWALTYDAIKRGELGVIEKLLHEILKHPLETKEQTLDSELLGKGEREGIKRDEK